MAALTVDAWLTERMKGDESLKERGEELALRHLLIHWSRGN